MSNKDYDFSKFIEDIDPRLKCMDECIVVTPNDDLIAFGKLIIAPKELVLGQQGMAVRVRSGIETSQNRKFFNQTPIY